MFVVFENGSRFRYSEVEEFFKLNNISPGEIINPLAYSNSRYVEDLKMCALRQGFKVNLTLKNAVVRIEVK